jgi:hypothetical protein
MAVDRAEVNQSLRFSQQMLHFPANRCHTSQWPLRSASHLHPAAVLTNIEFWDRRQVLAMFSPVIAMSRTLHSVEQPTTLADYKLESSVFELQTLT